MTQYRISKLIDAVNELNKIEDDKLTILATRVAQSVANDTGTPFTDNERSKLEASLEMTALEIDKVISALLEFFLESGHYNLPASVIATKLKNVELNPSKSKILIEVWSKSMEAIRNGLGKKSLLPQVGHISYNLSVEAGSDSTTNQKNIKGQIQLGLKSDDSTETLDVEFTQAELLDLHTQLLRLSFQLDNLAPRGSEIFDLI